jgi:hypothetical protein
MRRMAGQLGIGHLFYRVWYQPVGFVNRTLSEGPLETWRTARGRQAMRNAANRLPTCTKLPDGNVPVCFLTGQKFWEQTAFCAWSLMEASKMVFPWIVFDDGSLSHRDQTALTRVLGDHTRWVTPQEAEDTLDRVLPSSRFSALRTRRLLYPNLRKLVDVHAFGAGPKLVLDSDLLFFKRPDLLLDWLDKPRHPVAMRDCEESYGHPRKWLEALAAASLPESINVGICGLDSSTLDWNRVEYWLRALEERGGSYYDEQALLAMIFATGPHSILPHQYVCLPSAEEMKRPTATLHHYVAHAKHGYFREAWRCALGTHGASGLTLEPHTTAAAS